MEDPRVRAAISLRAFCEVVLERFDDDDGTPGARDVVNRIEDLCDQLDTYISLSTLGIADRNGFH